MSLRDKVLYLSLSTALLFLPGCLKTFPVRDRLPPKPAYQKINPVDKYALLVYAIPDFNSNYDKEGSDADSVNLFKMYNNLVKNNFPDNHIFILYGGKDDLPNFDAGNKTISKRVKEKQFNKQYNNTASRGNIEDILDGFKERVDNNDKVFVYIIGHGRKRSGTIKMGKGKSICSKDLQNYVDGWKSNSNYFLLGNCYSGKTIEDVKVDNVFLFAAAQEDKLNWLDTEWCSGLEFLKNKSYIFNDMNNDGIVDWEEAVNKLQLSAAIYYQKLVKYIEYWKEKGYWDFDSEDLNLQPVYKVGKNFKKTNLK